ncbi:MAG: 5-bromo-4-chloroindolyl phosphate hydrolysis family protein [Atopobiaceae bacterium]
MLTVISTIVAAGVGLACVFLVPGVVGIVAGAAAAVLLYLGLPLVLKPQARLGSVVASALPDGEAAAARVADARSLLRDIARIESDVRDQAVRGQIRQLQNDIEALVSYVERRPQSYRHLSHFMSTYSQQCLQVLRGYLSVEASAGPQELARAVDDAQQALHDLDAVAQGELKRAMGTEVTTLSTGSESIRRLMQMDGFSSDEETPDDDPKDEK